MWDKLLRRAAEREEALYAIQCTSGLEWTEAQLDRLGAIVERRRMRGYWSTTRPTPAWLP